MIDKLSKDRTAYPVIMRKGYFKFLFIGILGLLFLAVLFPPCSKEKSGKAVSAPLPVIVGIATQKTVPVQLRVIGNVQAYSTITAIDFALQAQRNQGKNPAEAIYDGCLIRFRPIMMTTMAALIGTLPIAPGFGAGAESRRPLGLAVVGGLGLFPAHHPLYHPCNLYLLGGSPG